MTGKREATRQDLTKRLVEAADVRMMRFGLDGLTARDVTQDAGCGLGTLYKCYRDLDELILRVNSRTLARLDRALAGAVRERELPVERLVQLALAYLTFALENTPAWSALFKHRPPADWVVPDWHVAEHRALFLHISKPLAEISPELDEASLAVRARSVFGAVHGIVALSIEGKFVGLAHEIVFREVETVIRAVVRGFARCDE